METREFGKPLTNLENIVPEKLSTADKLARPYFPAKPKKREFSHFTPRVKTAVSDSEVFSLAFNHDGTLLASAV